MGHVFISYSSTDRPYVVQLVKHLTAARLPVWYDQTIEAGEDFEAAIAAAVEASSVVVPVLSPASVGSKWVRWEVQRAGERGIPVLPLLLRPCDLGPLFTRVNLLDVTAGQMPSTRFVEHLQPGSPHGRAGPAAAPTLSPSSGSGRSCWRWVSIRASGRRCGRRAGSPSSRCARGRSRRSALPGRPGSVGFRGSTTGSARKRDTSWARR
ncbi:toll/interleukin-1 receptor domain-containing protein [Dactylosporangium sp. NPDC049525]|uniref:toll/interleukin-1 receptor domain-containing protein n=1 Tax=Dactylosporangium sp. NPDC049525 TaxID=3154730 RepID=UPI00341458E8